jgi:hypothetical protein
MRVPKTALATLCRSRPMCERLIYVLVRAATSRLTSSTDHVGRCQPNFGGCFATSLGQQLQDLVSVGDTHHADTAIGKTRRSMHLECLRHANHRRASAVQRPRHHRLGQPGRQGSKRSVTFHRRRRLLANRARSVLCFAAFSFTLSIAVLLGLEFVTNLW